MKIYPIAYLSISVLSIITLLIATVPLLLDQAVIVLIDLSTCLVYVIRVSTYSWLVLIK